MHKGKSLKKIKKKNSALASFKAGAAQLSPTSDIQLHYELQLYVAGTEPTLPRQTEYNPLQTSTIVEKSTPGSIAGNGTLQHSAGDPQLDQKIAMGYLLVNTGRYEDGIVAFNKLLEFNPRIIAAYLGRGTAFALSGNLTHAIVDFTSALSIDDRCVDAWKRRGQSLSAMGKDTEALADFQKASDLNPRDLEIFHQRGLVFYKTKNFFRAMKDFTTAIEIDGRNKMSWNHLGLCLNALGRSQDAIESYKKSTELEPSFKEGWANIGIAYKELGDFENAEVYFKKALDIDDRYSHAFHLRGMTRFFSGRHKLAHGDFTEAVQINPELTDCLHMGAVVRQGLGMYKLAISDYTRILQNSPDHYAWYQREVALYTHAHLDQDVSTFCMDTDLAPALKEGWCKKVPPKDLKGVATQKPYDTSIPDVIQDVELSKDEMAIIDASRTIGNKIQLNCAGYITNIRQHRSCGLAALELGQMLQRVWRNGEKVLLSGKGSTITTPHKFGWRDLYDIPIKWRQFSEPNDPVWWVDLLTPEQFAEGFGSHTPMISGQTRVMRYSPMAKRSIEIMKRLIVQQQGVSESLKRSVSKAENCEELHAAMRRDFWVVTPCYSTARPGEIMEGTRLTIQYVPPEGYEFSIRTPGTPPRWREYQFEMDFIYSELEKAASEPDINLDRVSDLILTMTFYWYNYMPLSRGTAAVGFISLLGMFLGIGIEISENVPKGQQVDWEGILRPKPEVFAAQLKPWMYPARKPYDMGKVPSVAKTLQTLRSRIQALNAT